MMTISGLASLQSVLGTGEGSFLIDFWGPSCSPCIDLNRTLEALESEFQERVAFIKVNADEEIDIASAYGVRGLPTILFVYKGEVVHRWIGMLSLPALKGKLEKALGGVG